MSDLQPDMAARILKYVQLHDHATFAELSWEIDGFKGSREIGLWRANIVYWSGLSDEAERAIYRLWRKRRIAMEPTDPLLYAIDGASLLYPLARSPLPYQKPHWLPVILRPAESAPDWVYVPRELA